MRIGIPREIKTLEGRVGLVPAACGELVRAGHQVFIEQGAGAASGYEDGDYRAAGAEVVADAAAAYGQGELIVKVKEPVDADLALLRADHLLFCYLHLAANPELARRLQDIGLTAVAFETVQEPGGALPLLAPMSDIAGRLAAQIGASLLHQPQGGRGLLLGGLPAAERGHVVVIGGGVAGGNAAAVAAALGARVTVFDRNREKLAALRALGDNVSALYAYQDAMDQAVEDADLLIGAVLTVGARAAHVVSAELVRRMRPGSVVMDISVDQGGCVETTRPTTYAEPTYLWEEVVHFAVTNMPGAVPRTAVQALSAALIPYLGPMADGRWRDHDALYRGLNVEEGRLVHPGVRAALAGRA
ncbi:MAG TPA: alanine dehydrogenase [Gammaproteobacteria bacterium]|nr:alanine dehydrogenase [Gammaproteobacteria bacterium]